MRIKYSILLSFCHSKILTFKTEKKRDFSGFFRARGGFVEKYAYF